MRKDNKKINISLNKIYPLLIVVSTFFMCIGYATVNSIILDISGNATAILYSGVFITNVEYVADENAHLDNCKILTTHQTTLNSAIELSDEDKYSSITYNITVYNNSNEIYTYTGAVYANEFYSNPNIAFEITDLNVNDSIMAREYKTFQIKFYYLDDIIAENTLESLINFNFEVNTWEEITVYGMENYNIINSKDGNFVTINYTSVPVQYEKINLPLNNLEIGEIYQLTFTTWNDSEIITTGLYYTLVYGCTVMPNPLTNFMSPEALIAYDGYNSGYMWKTLSVEEQTVTLTFKATQETMYWVWDLSLVEDQPGNLYIKDISLSKSIKPNGAYVDIPNTDIFQVEYLNSGQKETITVQKGTYITKADYDDLIVKIQTAGGYEFINIPIKNLVVGQTYTLSFSNLTTEASKVDLRYGCTIKANKINSITGQLITASDYNITDLSIVNSSSITFTATATTMYWIWDLGGLEDYRWSDIRIYDVSLN